MPSSVINRRITLSGSLSNPFLDVYPGARVAFSFRKLRNSYSGNCVMVRRSSDNATLNIGFLNGYLDTATLLSFCGAGDGFLRTWFDQSGNGLNIATSVAGAQPKLVSSGSLILNNGRLSAFFLDTSRKLSASSASDWKFMNDGTNHTVYAVTQPGIVSNPTVDYPFMGTNNGTSSNTGFFIYYLDSGASNDVFWHQLTNSSGSAATSVANNFSSNNALTANTLHVLTVLVDPTNVTGSERSDLRVDGGAAIKNSTVTGAVNNANPAFPLEVGGTGNSSGGFVGYMSEIIIYPIKQDATTNTAIQTNLLDYY